MWSISQFCTPTQTKLFFLPGSLLWARDFWFRLLLVPSNNLPFFISFFFFVLFYEALKRQKLYCKEAFNVHITFLHLREFYHMESSKLKRSLHYITNYCYLYRVLNDDQNFKRKGFEFKCDEITLPNRILEDFNVHSGCYPNQSLLAHRSGRRKTICWETHTLCMVASNFL